MSVKRVEIPSSVPAVPSGGESAAEMTPEPRTRSPRQDFVFAVKLFGITGLVIFLIWLMNRAVS